MPTVWGVLHTHALTLRIIASTLEFGPLMSDDQFIATSDTLTSVAMRINEIASEVQAIRAERT